MKFSELLPSLDSGCEFIIVDVDEVFELDTESGKAVDGVFDEDDAFARASSVSDKHTVLLGSC